MNLQLLERCHLEQIVSRSIKRPCKSNEVFDLKFYIGYQVKHKDIRVRTDASEASQKLHRPKRCVYNDRNENRDLHNSNNTTKQIVVDFEMNRQNVEVKHVFRQKYRVNQK